MTETKNFATIDAAKAFLAALGGYDAPPAVVPLQGEAAHEVAVGPVHAGVIEPGHFRFQCMGEKVYNLQIFLGYQHRGVIAEILKADGNLPRQLALVETVAGDSSIAAATAFAEIIEERDRLRPDGSALRLRTLLLELERLANHVGDLGALSGDVAFLPTASFCGRLRGEYLNMTALLCGNRFGRHAVVPGGLRCELTETKRTELVTQLQTAKRDLDAALKLMFESPTVCERLDGTGSVPRDVAERLGLVGVARRASVELKGDVLSRALVRRMEIEEAHRRLFELLGEPATEVSARVATAGDPPAPERPPFTAIVATVAAWRGPLVHAAVFADDRKMVDYHITDPSAHNWQGLAWALRGEQISNFPICNKSFNLSYCGTDL